jgi:hypothetical protein
MPTRHFLGRFCQLAFATVLSAACLLSAPPQARADDNAPTDVPKRFVGDCERQLQPTQVDVVAYPSEIQYDFSQGVAALTKRPTLFREGGTHTLGLTEATFRMDVKWNGDILMDSMTQKGCTRPRITIKLKVGPQRVFVGREFPQGSCAFWKIADHELRHVKANQAQVEKVAEKLQEVLRASFGNRIFYGNPAELKAALTDNLEDQWMPWAKDQFQQVEADHQAIDSSQEYESNASACQGEIPRVLSASGIK